MNNKTRKGYTTVDGKSPMEYLKMLFDLQGDSEQHDIIASGDENVAEEYLRENLEQSNYGYEQELKMIAEEYEEFMRDGSRKGSCGYCERPENLSNVASTIVTGMNRKIGEPSRKGAPAFATGNSGKLMNDFNKVLNNDTVSTKLQKTFGTQDQRNQAILKEHNNNQSKIDRQNKVDQLRNGSRKGSSLWTLKGSERQDLYNRIDSKLKSEGKPWDYVYTVTGKDYEDSAYSAFAEMPENKDWINGLILEITRDRNGRKGGYYTDIPKDVLTIIENSVIIDGVEYDFVPTRKILESQGYSVSEIDDYVDEYMIMEMDKQLQ